MSCRHNPTELHIAFWQHLWKMKRHAGTGQVQSLSFFQARFRLLLRYFSCELTMASQNWAILKYFNILIGENIIILFPNHCICNGQKSLKAIIQLLLFQIFSSLSFGLAFLKHWIAVWNKGSQLITTIFSTNSCLFAVSRMWAEGSIQPHVPLWTSWHTAAHTGTTGLRVPGSEDSNIRKWHCCIIWGQVFTYHLLASEFTLQKRLL